MLKFKLQRSADDQWYFEIQGANNETLATSETYHDKRDAVYAIDLIRQGADDGSLVIV